ncbi:MAG: hypothetical protein QOC64_2290 [Solirubrobacteraceae bacterium]|jgi:hypothetical protein|nr:hypothetical protein [Solirubrobacteraceae bacterium]
MSATVTRPTTTQHTAITIRPAVPEDDQALRRLAQLDGARLPHGDILVAEVDGELRAALRVTDRAYVADPFFPSRELVALLDVRARRLRQETLTTGQRVRARLSLWTALWHRAATTRPSL